MWRLALKFSFIDKVTSNYKTIPKTTKGQSFLSKKGTFSTFMTGNIQTLIL